MSAPEGVEPGGVVVINGPVARVTRLVALASYPPGPLISVAESVESV